MSAESAYAPNLDEVLDKLAEAPRYNAWLFGRARPWLGRRTIDAGAGTGTFTELAAEVCDEVAAVEPDPPFAAHLRQRFAQVPNVHVHEVDVTQLAAAGLGGFDSAICFNVLEHVPDDRLALEQIRDALAPGGHLLLLVPAHPRLYGATDRAIGHVRRYERDPLDRLLQQAGYGVSELRHVNPIGALWWLLSSRSAQRDQAPFKPLAAVDRVIPLLRPFDRLRLPVGLSLWAVGVRR